MVALTERELINEFNYYIKVIYKFKFGRFSSSKLERY